MEPERPDRPSWEGPAARPSYTADAGAADWLRAALTTFAEGVHSFLPAGCEAYLRVYHPFEAGGDPGRTTTWREEIAAAGVEIPDPAAAERFALHGVEGAQARVGSLPPGLVDPLVEHLGRATSTPERCHFALWEGYSGSRIPAGLEPSLELPFRRYHLFSGPLAAARASFAAGLGWQSANLWWPADRAWCVATEVDFAWTYVGGARSCIDSLRADPRLEAVETSARARW